MKRVALGKSKVLLRNGANILKSLICEPFILNFSILGLIFHSLSKKCFNGFTDVYGCFNIVQIDLRQQFLNIEKTNTFEE
jgi:hypothetical protein